MALLTSQYNSRKVVTRDIVAVPVEASTYIYLGGLVATDDNGYAIPAQPATGTGTITKTPKVRGRAAGVYGGIAGSDANNSSGAAGAIVVLVERGIFVYGGDSSIVQSANSQHVYCIDDHTVSLNAGGTAISAEAHTIPASGPLIVQLTKLGLLPASLVVKNSGNSTTYVLGTDYYIIDAANSIIGFMGGTLTASTVVHISYNWGAPDAGVLDSIDPVTGEFLLDTLRAS